MLRIARIHNHVIVERQLLALVTSDVGWIRVSGAKCEQTADATTLTVDVTTALGKSLALSKGNGHERFLVLADKIDWAASRMPALEPLVASSVIYCGGDPFDAWYSAMKHAKPQIVPNLSQEDRLDLKEWTCRAYGVMRRSNPPPGSDFDDMALRTLQVLSIAVAPRQRFGFVTMAADTSEWYARVQQRPMIAEGDRAGAEWIMRMIPDSSLQGLVRDAYEEVTLGIEREQDRSGRGRKRDRDGRAVATDEAIDGRRDKKKINAAAERLREWKPEKDAVVPDGPDGTDVWAGLAAACTVRHLFFDNHAMHRAVADGWFRRAPARFFLDRLTTAMLFAPRAASATIVKQAEQAFEEDHGLARLCAAVPQLVHHVLATQTGSTHSAEHMLPWRASKRGGASDWINVLLNAGVASVPVEPRVVECEQSGAVLWKWYKAFDGQGQGKRVPLSNLLRFYVQLTAELSRNAELYKDTTDERPWADPTQEDCERYTSTKIIDNEFRTDGPAALPATIPAREQPCPNVWPVLAETPLLLMWCAWWLRMEQSFVDEPWLSVWRLQPLSRNPPPETCEHMTNLTSAFLKANREQMAVDKRHLFRDARMLPDVGDALVDDAVKDADLFRDWMPRELRNVMGRCLRWLRIVPCPGRPNLVTSRGCIAVNRCVAHQVALIKRNGFGEAVELEEIAKVAATMTPVPDDTQQRAVQTMMQEPIVSLRGGSGTGKTTTMKLLDAVIATSQLSVAYLAPTGAAVRRLAQLVPGLATSFAKVREKITKARDEGREPDPFRVAGTVDAATYPMSHHALQDIGPDVVVIDETSMVSTLLAAKLLLCLSQAHELAVARAGPHGEPPKRCKLVLVGDSEQLYPVEPGAPFLEMIESGHVPVVTLLTTYRSKSLSLKQTGANIRSHVSSAGSMASFPDIFRINHRDGVADQTTDYKYASSKSFREKLAADYARSVRALPDSPLHRIIISPCKDRALGTIQMCFLAQQTWHSTSAHSSQAGTEQQCHPFADSAKQKQKQKHRRDDLTKEERNRPKLEDVSKWQRNQTVALSVKSWQPKWQDREEDSWAKLFDGKPPAGLDRYSFAYRAGDPVMATKKIPPQGIVNGDVFVLLAVIPKKRRNTWWFVLRDDVQNRVLFVKSVDFQNSFVPAYAITVHKAQGAEYEHVFFVAPFIEYDQEEQRQHLLQVTESTDSPEPKFNYYRLMNKRLLYTAVTRAKTVLSIYGRRSGYLMCLDNVYAGERNDFLRHCIDEELRRV